MPALPIIAILGRPNVGKSTLFNRLTRSRRAIVGDEPGITRDRLYGEAEWRGRRFELADTGGIMPETDEPMPRAVREQARRALAPANAVLLMVDGRAELSAADLDLAEWLRRTGKPIYLLVNKMDDERREQHLGAFYRLGIRPLFAISAEQGRNLDQILDALCDAGHLGTKEEARAADETEETNQTSEAETDKRAKTSKRARIAKRTKIVEPEEEIDSLAAEDEALAEKPLSVAIIGRPNVGKSTLLNRLLGEERAIVTPIAGTTRDTVDALLTRGKRQYRLLDTAGIRRKGKTRLMAEKLSVVMARRYLRQADVALLVMDMAEGVTALDATIAGYAIESGSSCILVGNKADLARSAGRKRSDFEQEVRRRCKFLAYAPLAMISAAEGRGVETLWRMLDEVAAARRRRIPTAELNRFFAALDFQRATAPAGRKLKIYYLSQVAVAPPTFLLFASHGRALHFAYQRFLENQLRRAFGFSGTPLRIRVRASRGPG